MIMMGIVFFTGSLQSGFYTYQFRMLGWTLVSSLSLVQCMSGLLQALAKNRIWFFYAVTCIAFHNGIDYLVCHYWPTKTKLTYLKPEATLEGFFFGAVACFLLYATVSQSDQ